MVGHLNQADPGDGSNDVPGFVKNPIVPTQVAGIVVGDPGFHAFFELKPTIRDQLLKHQGVMSCPESGFRVFVFECMKAVG